MTRKTWEQLSFFEQLSNIDGDVNRLIRAHEKYINGDSEVDNGYFYLDNIKKQVRMILLAPGNENKGYRAIELYDEIDGLRKYLEGEYDEIYIRSYWSQYTKAIS